VEDQCPFPELLALFALHRGVKAFVWGKGLVLGAKKAWFYLQGKSMGFEAGEETNHNNFYWVLTASSSLSLGVTRRGGRPPTSGPDRQGRGSIQKLNIYLE